LRPLSVFEEIDFAVPEKIRTFAVALRAKRLRGMPVSLQPKTKKRIAMPTNKKAETRMQQSYRTIGTAIFIGGGLLWAYYHLPDARHLYVSAIRLYCCPFAVFIGHQ